MGSSLSVKARDAIRAAEKIESDELFLTNCKIKKLPKNIIKKFRHLRKLGLSHNYIATLPKGFHQFVALEELYVDFNELTIIPEDLFDVKTLTVLNLSNNQLTSIPPSIGELKQLKQLDISENVGIKALPNVLADLELTTLRFGQSGLKEIPEVIYTIVSLKVLGLKGNFLTDIPDKISELVNLEDIDLSNNPLKKFPLSITHLKSLETINFSHTQIESLEDVPLRSLKNLKNLLLSSCSIQKFTRSIGECKKLEVLDLSHNQLKRIPKEIGYTFATLNQLSLEDNQLTDLPGEINMLDPSIKMNFRGNPLVPPFDLHSISIIEFFDAILPHCKAYGPNCDCQGEGIKTAVKKIGTSFTILAKDYRDRKRVCGGDSFEVTIIKESDDDVYQCDTVVKDKKDGTYEVFYNPLQTGTYRVHISCESIPFKNSPYSLVVFDS